MTKSLGSVAQLHRHIDFITLASVLASGCYIIILMYKEAWKPLGFGEWFAPFKNHRSHPREGLGSYGTGQGF